MPDSILMPDKRRLVTSKVCFGSEKAGLLEISYNKCALKQRTSTLIFVCFSRTVKYIQHYLHFYWFDVIHSFFHNTLSTLINWHKSSKQINSLQCFGNQTYYCGVLNKWLALRATNTIKLIYRLHMKGGTGAFSECTKQSVQSSDRTW